MSIDTRSPKVRAPTKRQQIQRLENLIRVMRGLSRHERTEHFNMRHWVENTACGTTMCAAGFCAADQWFQRLGLRLKRDDFGMMNLSYRHLWSWDAIPVFFGRLNDESENGWSLAGSHPIFAKPKSVGDVIRAAKASIKELCRA